MLRRSIRLTRGSRTSGTLTIRGSKARVARGGTVTDCSPREPGSTLMVRRRGEVLAEAAPERATGRLDDRGERPRPIPVAYYQEAAVEAAWSDASNHRCNARAHVRGRGENPDEDSSRPRSGRLVRPDLQVPRLADGRDVYGVVRHAEEPGEGCLDIPEAALRLSRILDSMKEVVELPFSVCHRRKLGGTGLSRNPVKIAFKVGDEALRGAQSAPGASDRETRLSLAARAAWYGTGRNSPRSWRRSCRGHMETSARQALPRSPHAADGQRSEPRVVHPCLAHSAVDQGVAHRASEPPGHLRRCRRASSGRPLIAERLPLPGLRPRPQGSPRRSASRRSGVTKRPSGIQIDGRPAVKGCLSSIRL